MKHALDSSLIYQLLNYWAIFLDTGKRAVQQLVAVGSEKPSAVAAFNSRTLQPSCRDGMENISVYVEKKGACKKRGAIPGPSLF